MMRYAAIFMLAMAAFSEPAAAGPVFNVTGHAMGSGPYAAAAQHVRVTLVREGFENEKARQVSSADAGAEVSAVLATRVPGNAFALDAGSQWATLMAANQKVVAVAEVMAGLNGWNGESLAGALVQTVAPTDLHASQMQMSSGIELRPIPVPRLLEAREDRIAIEIGRFDGDLATGLAIYRRGGGEREWRCVGSLPQAQGVTANVFVDTSVTAQAVYEYGVAVVFSSNGLTQSVQTEAKAISPEIWASRAQVSPRDSDKTLPVKDMPGGWCLAPNPISGGIMEAFFATEGPAQWTLIMFSIAGERVLNAQGLVEKSGTHRVAVNVSKLATGVYLARLEIRGENQAKPDTFIFKKMAIKR